MSFKKNNIFSTIEGSVAGPKTIFKHIHLQNLTCQSLNGTIMNEFVGYGTLILSVYDLKMKWD